MKRIALLVLLAIAANATAAPSQLKLDRAQLDRFAALKSGDTIVVDRFPDAFGGAAQVTFRRVEVYAPGARIVVVDDTGEHEIPRSRRIELIGTTASGDMRVSLGFDPAKGALSGVGTTSAGTFVVRAEKSTRGMNLRSIPIEATYPADVVPQIIGTDDALPSGRPDPSALALALASHAPEGTLRSAVVAVDTDNEFMSRRFGNNTTDATDWIADLFTTMNVMYQRDLNVVLQQGTTMLRTTTDPYTQTGTPANQADLTEFGTYWQTHYAAVQRSFAMLLSGKSASGDQASGIAWINAYCETQSQGGSYSVNQIFTDSGVNVSLSARIVGHELGHNFGAYHTHCTNIATGGAPTGTNTIDQCYNGEAGSGCYSGAVSCPTSGPGHPLGTLMSYCNTSGPNSADCGQNVLQFHPTQITTLSALINQNTPSCLAFGGGDLIFSDGFD